MNPWLILVVFEAVVIVGVTLGLVAALRSAARERSDLLARIQAHTPAEYMAYRQAEAADVDPVPSQKEEKQPNMGKYPAIPQVEIDTGAAMNAASQLMGG